MTPSAAARVRVAFLAVVVGVLPGAAATAPIAATPPMGWNSWNHFGLEISDAIVRAQAEAMVRSGMRDAGYVYLVIDDGWQGERGPDGRIRPNERFPDMQALGDFLHTRGLKFGIYSTPGKLSCGKFPGSFGHEEQDAQTFAEWGVDYLKYDLCSYNDEVISRLPTETDKVQAQIAAYRKMADALQRTGRPIVFSICQYGLNYVWRWGREAGGHLWRTTSDIGPDYMTMSKIGFSQAGLARYAGPGGWNDPDMLEVGNGMSADEDRTHLTLWAMLAAPLMAGNDLTQMSPDVIALLTHREVLAINQDPAGIQGDRVHTEGYYEIWMKPLQDGSKAVGVFNRQDAWTRSAVVRVDLRHAGFPHGGHVRDVWKGEELGHHTTLEITVPAHGTALLRVRE